jgi:NitT/TauT family transport system substrate-binding protein
MKKIIGSKRRIAVITAVCITFVGLVSSPCSSSAAELVKVAVGQRGNWTSSVSDIGLRAGIFQKHGIDLEIFYTQGSGETQQAVISGAADIGISMGTIGAIGAFSKGAPVRIIAAEIKGGADLYWYVRSDSPIKNISDAAGKTVAYSTSGSSTQGVVNAFNSENSWKLVPVATGNPPATLTQVMSGQVDIGWGAPPFGIDLIDQKKIRVVATGNDTSFKDQTLRVVGSNANTLQQRPEAVRRYMDAYRETQEFMYTDNAALKIFADWLGISPELARRSRDDYFPRDAVFPDRILGIDKIMEDAVRYKFATAPLNAEQVKELIQIQQPMAK